MTAAIPAAVCYFYPEKSFRAKIETIGVSYCFFEFFMIE